MSIENSTSIRLDFVKLKKIVCFSIDCVRFSWRSVSDGCNVTLHEFCVREYDVRLLYRPLSKRIHPKIYIHPNYNRLCSMLYPPIPRALLRINGVGLRLFHHLLDKVGKSSMLNFICTFRTSLWSAQDKWMKCIVVYFEFDFWFEIIKKLYVCACICVFVCI